MCVNQVKKTWEMQCCDRPRWINGLRSTQSASNAQRSACVGHFPNQRRVLVVSMYMAQNVQSTSCKNISIISRNLNKYHMMNVNIRRCAIFLNFLDFSKTESKWNDDTFYHKTLHPVKVCWYGIHYMQEIQKIVGMRTSFQECIIQSFF